MSIKQIFFSKKRSLSIKNNGETFCYYKNDILFHRKNGPSFITKDVFYPIEKNNNNIEYQWALNDYIGRIDGPCVLVLDKNKKIINIEWWIHKKDKPTTEQKYWNW